VPCLPSWPKHQGSANALIDAALQRNGKASGQAPGCFFAVAQEIHSSTMTWQMMFRSVSFDILGIHASRAAHRSVSSSDLLKLMMDQRKGQPGLLVGVMMFNLLAYHLNFVQRQLTSLGTKFKSITLVFFALAIFDQMPRPLPEAAGSVAGVVLLVLIRAFATFPWRDLEVNIRKDGSTCISKKTLSAEVILFLDVQDGNSTYNVMHEHVDSCQDRAKTIGSDEILVPSLKKRWWSRTSIREGL
jgi:hypothetical protein